MATGIGQPALSQQLAALRQADVVKTRREGKQICYDLADESVRLCVRTMEALLTDQPDPKRVMKAATFLGTAAEKPMTGNGAAGVDISPDLVSAARKRAVKSSAPNIEFTCADASTVQLADAPYDRLFSRFGSMFFEDPVSAFSNLRGLVRKGGRIDLAIWGPPRDNLWMMEMMGVVRNHVEVPPAVPRAPGPFAFEDLEYLGEIMDGSGFTDMDVVAYQGLQPVGGVDATPEKAVAFALSAMAAGRLLSDKGEAILAAATSELTDVFARHHVPGKGVMMQGKAWLVSAIA